jgi:hypothetical protein
MVPTVIALSFYLEISSHPSIMANPMVAAMEGFHYPDHE